MVKKKVILKKGIVEKEILKKGILKKGIKKKVIVQKNKIIAVIPAYNEAKHIVDVVKGVKEYVDEVIVVDDGSRDKTYDNAQEADYVLKHIVNLGKGMAMKTGFEAALTRRADVVVFIDADGQHKPEDILKLLDKLNKERLDIVTAVRKFDDKMPIVHRFGNWFLLNAFNFLFHYNIKDFSNGLRVIKTDHYQKIKWQSSDYAVEAEMLAKAGNYKLKVGEVLIETIYLDKIKGTTIFDGINIFIKMVYWKVFG